MNTPEHTRGPWKVISEAAAREVEVFEVAEVSRFRVICDGPGDGFDRSGDAFADARLIAAAPELLRALIAGPSQLHTPPAGEGPCRCSQCAFVMLRDAAIAKATGIAA
jgi:hypothetical protein